jgi:HSP20 family protein
LELTKLSILMTIYWRMTMLQTVYYDPFRAFAPARRSPAARAEAGTSWSPGVDIIESKDEYRLLLDMPGIDPASIDITEEKKVLSISAEKPSIELKEGEVVSRSERKSGNYQRKFTLPDDADVESIVAKSNNGVLNVTIRRVQPVETQRKIEISH